MSKHVNSNHSQSIDLTRLPSVSVTGAKSAEKGDSSIEYSAREVSPTPLLLQQVLKAHRIFLLHHAPTLSDLFVRCSRDKFCGYLERYWTRFCRNWDVLLHGNPAVDVFGGLKLAAGGELGVGVGEEEWGSGEREVLEDLVRQTEGLVDLTVSRFGQPALSESDDATDHLSASAMPWLGRGHLPDAADGLIFGGVGAIERTTLRHVAAWVEQIYTYGEYAYGVKDNPQRQRRTRRRPQRPANKQTELADHEQSEDTNKAESKPELDVSLPLDSRPEIHDRIVSHDHATGTSSPHAVSHPGIPPPIVTAAEESLTAAAKAVDSSNSSKQSSSQDKPEPASTFGMSDKWIKYLTLGLSTYSQGSTSRSNSPSKQRPAASRAVTSSSVRSVRSMAQRSKEPDIAEEEENGPMQTLAPAPDGHELSSQLALQKHRESVGHFLIGYTGDLSTIPTDDKKSPVLEREADSGSEDGGSRTILRTLQIEVRPKQHQQTHEDELEAPKSPSRTSSFDNTVTGRYRRLRVLIYVHRPFIYTFLFEQRTNSLGIISFYSQLHSHLQPLHRSLLRSTSLAHVAQRIAQAHSSPPASIDTENTPFAPPRSSPVFDLVHDPLTLTTHTSIPNIPDPGTPAAEGIATTSLGRSGPPTWTHLEAINVHSQILNTLSATRLRTLGCGEETERTSKTSRGWWVVWMRIPPTPTTSSVEEEDQGPEAEAEEGYLGRGRYQLEDCRVAFLVRKASDGMAVKGKRGVSSGYSSRAVSSVGGMFGFGGGGGSGGSSAGVAEDGGDQGAAGGVGWGLGIDARKYVEGLLSLNR